jgi:CubicO group peptidase (beta-lactamase class C family)
LRFRLRLTSSPVGRGLKARTMKRRFLFIGIAAVLVGVGAYLAITLSGPSIPYTYQPPENINDGLDVGTLDEVSIDSELIEKAMNEINRGKYGEVHSVLVFKDDKLVLEEYFEGHEYQWDAPNYHGELVAWNRSMPHVLQSVTKSITSACVGIAIDKGFIGSVDEPIFEYLPEYQYVSTDGKDKITIEHLLAMTSGLEWTEWNAPYSSRDNPMIEIWFQEAEQDKHPFTFILEGSLIDEPGTTFRYFGGNQVLLGGIIENATQMDIDEFSAEYLFGPLDIDSFDWWSRFESGVIEAAAGLKMTPRDMVKFGVMYLNDGAWNGEQIVSEQWVEESAVPFGNNEGIDVPGTDERDVGYSYSWWTKTFYDAGREIDVFYALGWGGQSILVFPDLNTVVVFTGGAYTSTTRTFSLLERYIIPAID